MLVGMAPAEIAPPGRTLRLRSIRVLALCATLAAAGGAAAYGYDSSYLAEYARDPEMLGHFPKLRLALPPPGAIEVVCPEGMALVRQQFCIDRYEASTVSLDAGGRPLGDHSPYEMGKNDRVRAASRAGVHPQAHVTLDQARAACENAGKRLCDDDEWLAACRGMEEFSFPYGPGYEPGRCNDRGSSPFYKLLGHDPPPSIMASPVAINNPLLNQQGGLAKTGGYAGCVSADGVYDLVGNLHEWTSDPRGTFRGGYYRDVREHGQGCNYVTKGHDARYRDYSTGFRCCAMPEQRAASPRPRRDGDPARAPAAALNAAPR
jgi:formylglycine-generating enzyme